jgi:hypothetical protein
MKDRIAACLKQLHPNSTPEQITRAQSLIAKVLRLLKVEHGIELRYIRKAPQTSHTELSARVQIENWLKPSRIPGGYWPRMTQGAPPYERTTLVPHTLLREYSHAIGRRIAELQLTNEIRLTDDDIKFVRSYSSDPGVRLG